MPACPVCGHEYRQGARYCESCGGALAAAAPAATSEQRKRVTVLFSDVTGSTALGERLDPESLRAVMARYFELARRVVERHGGTVEKFIGDAVMAVFGVPVLHEDDALRAVRAAAELQSELAGLNASLERDYATALELRIGVNTGEVVTGTEERLATGDAVNVAARLEQAARPGEILLGPDTVALVRDVAVVEAAGPLELKGKAGLLAAYRLVSVSPTQTPPRLGTAMVGRTRELERLRAAMAQAVTDGSCQLFTVLGAAGVGKSRLSYEFLAGLGEATVVRGTCLSYGDGITYWPVVAILKQLLGDEPERRLDEAGLDEGGARAIRALLGEGGGQTSQEEIAWAMRRLLEAEAGRAPLVVVLDDIHWGEEAFLDLVDHIADLSRDAPILLLCMARPELLDRRPSWGGGKLNATTVLLEPLAAADAEALVEILIDDAQVDQVLRSRIVDAAEGNPLFVQEMVGLLRDGTGDGVMVPPTIQALLAARLDQLDPTERTVLERGSVEGRVFHRGAVQALSPTTVDLRTPLTALVRRELVRPDRPQYPGEDAYRFRHLLIRDAAYDALPKAVRAEMHELFATWMGEHGADLVELDEVVGYHLERAYRYRVELGPAGESGVALAGRAAERLAAAGLRAVARGDLRAATSLLGRADALFAPDAPARLAILPSFGRALHDAGDWHRARSVLDDALARAEAAGDRRAAADATVSLAHLNMFTDALGTHDEVRALLAEPLRVFEELGDQAGLARSHGLAGQLRFWAGHAAAAIVDLERAADHACEAGDRQQESQSLSYVLIAALHGPVPVADALALCASTANRLAGDRRFETTALRCVANLEAMSGEIGRARAAAAAALAIANELGLEVSAAGARSEGGRVEALGGDPAAAERVATPGLEALEAMGNHGHWVTVAIVVADAVFAQGRPDEAEALVDRAADWAMKDDIDPQIGWRRIKAKVLALRGELEAAERLGREAVEIAARTDYLENHALARADLAEVLERAGRADEARVELEHALRLYELKGIVVEAERMRARLAEAGPVPGTTAPGTGVELPAT
jgi:class 3 adenylate cyclase/tetratricopeptide (TPR) repeat protein